MAVFMTNNVMVINGSLLKARLVRALQVDLSRAAHGPKDVSVDILLEKDAKICIIYIFIPFISCYQNMITNGFFYSYGLYNNRCWPEML